MHLGRPSPPPMKRGHSAHPLTVFAYGKWDTCAIAWLLQNVYYCRVKKLPGNDCRSPKVRCDVVLRWEFLSASNVVTYCACFATAFYYSSCRPVRPARGQKYVLLSPTPMYISSEKFLLPAHLFQAVRINFVPPFPTSTPNHRWILVAIDLMTPYGERKTVSLATAQKAAQFCIVRS